MTQSFKDYLDATQPDADTVVQAVRYYLAERSEDLLEEEMLEQVRSGRNAQEVDAARDELSRDPVALESAALAVLSCAWEGEGEPEQIRAGFAGAKSKLPIPAIGILATVTLYGMWLLATGGVKSRKRVVQRRRDGTRVTFEEVEFYGPPPVAKLLKFFGSLGG